MTVVDDPRIHDEIFELSSKDCTGISELRQSIPHIVRQTNPHFAMAIDHWDDVVQRMRTMEPQGPNDLGIRTQEEIREGIDETLLEEAGLGSILDEMHHHGQLLYLPAIPQAPNDAESVVLLNADLASKCIYRLQKVADENSGRIEPEKLESMIPEGLQFSARDSYGQTISYDVKGSDVKALLEFLKAAGIYIPVKDTLVFPYACHMEPEWARNRWDELTCRPPNPVSPWTDSSTKSDIIGRLSNLFDLEVLAVWNEGPMWNAGALLRRSTRDETPEMFLRLTLERKRGHFRAELSGR